MPRISGVPISEHESLAEVLRLFWQSLDKEGEDLRAGDDCLTWHFEETADSEQCIHIRLLEGRTVLEQGWTDLKGRRRERKRLLYRALETLLDTHFPWGSLTGIRPTLVANQIYERHKDLERAREELIQTWRLSAAKADKALETGLKEKEILSAIPKDSVLVYAGVPFCPTRCSYCSFICKDAFGQSKWLSPYTDALIREIRELAPFFPGEVSAFYMGGGTPTALSDTDFDRFLEAVRLYLPLSPHVEFTVEAGRPDTLSPRKLEILARHGVERICINPQTLKDETLKRVGRRHTVAEFEEVYRAARAIGFQHINMDLILGLPGEEPADFLDSLDGILALHPESISTHALCLKRSARLHEEEEGAWTLKRFPNREVEAAMEEGDRRLHQAGYQPYYLYRQKNVLAGLENTGFALPGQGSRYNVGMMSDQRTVIAFGSGASSKWVVGTRVDRLLNSKDIRDYTERIDTLIERKLAWLKRGMDAQKGLRF